MYLSDSPPDRPAEGRVHLLHTRYKSGKVKEITVSYHNMYLSDSPLDRPAEGIVHLLHTRYISQAKRKR